MTLPRVGLIGASGYGRVHLEHLLELHGRRELELVAAVVIDHEAHPETCARLRTLGCRILPTWAEFVGRLAELRLELVIVPTPIHLHASMALELLGAGIHVLIEKPLAATVGEAAAVAAAARKANRIAAVGFQYLHAAEVQALKERLVRGDIGRVKRIAVHAAWPRSHGYYTRNDWAGRLRTPQGWVLDSPVANAMAHFFVLLFYFAGDTMPSATRAVRLKAELYRAQAIDSFDTAVITIQAANGCSLEFYGTHSSHHLARPTLVIEADRGRAEWIQDREVRLVGSAGEWRELAAPEPLTRERMLRDVLAQLRGQNRFVCGPELALEHVRCVDALHEHAPIATIPRSALATRHEDADTFTYVPGLDAALARAFQQHGSLARAGAIWAVPPTEIDLSRYVGLPAPRSDQPAAPDMNC